MLIVVASPCAQLMRKSMAVFDLIMPSVIFLNGPTSAVFACTPMMAKMAPIFWAGGGGYVMQEDVEGGGEKKARSAIIPRQT